jgi:hypothetical protein
MRTALNEYLENRFAADVLLLLRSRHWASVGHLQPCVELLLFAQDLGKEYTADNLTDGCSRSNSKSI